MSNSLFAGQSEPSKEEVHIEPSPAATLPEIDTKGKPRVTSPDTKKISDRGKEKASPEKKTAAVAALTIAISLVAFTAALDSTILEIAIPHITAEFDLLDNAAWYHSASFAACAGLQLPLGKAYAYFDAKWLYLASLAVFELGCVLCAYAPGPGVFIAGRAVSGTGIAGLYPGAARILGSAAPARLLPTLFGIVTGVVAVASLVGPPLGGVFTDSPRLTWRWCFWVNVPLGAVAGGVALLIIPPSQSWKGKDAGGSDGDAYSSAKHDLESPLSLGQKIVRLDPMSTIFLGTAIASLLLALQWGGISHYWTDGEVWGCLASAGLLFSAFTFVQDHLGDSATASIPQRLLRSRSAVAGAVLATTMSAASSAHVFLLPFYFQIVRGTTATGSGLRMLAYLGAGVLSGVVFGAAASRGRAARHWAYGCVGAGMFAVGAGLMHTLAVDTAVGTAVASQLVAGAAVGVACQVPFVAARREGDPGGRDAADALIAFANAFGAALGIFIAQNVFLGALLRGLTDVDGVSPGQIVAIMRAGRLVGLRDPGFMDPALLDGVLPAFAGAVDAAFLFPVVAGVLAFLVSFILLW